MHYVTFDGVHYNLLAGCRYILLQDRTTQDGTDVILINDNNMVNTAPAKKKVLIKDDGREIMLGRKLPNGKFVVHVDKKLVNLPYNGNPKIKEVNILVNEQIKI